MANVVDQQAGERRKQRRINRLEHSRARQRRGLSLEPLEDRMLMAIGAGPDLVEMVTNDGAALVESDVRRVSPRELLLRFDSTQVIDPASLGAIGLVRSGGDNIFSFANGTVSAATSASQFAGDMALSAVDDFYNGQQLRFTSGALNGQFATVTDYDGLSRTFTLSAPLTAIPAVNDLFQVDLNQRIAPAFTGIGDRPNEVVLRFAERLPDDFYRATIVGVGPQALRNTAGFPFQQNLDPAPGGTDLTRNFRLDLGAQIVSVVPQPVFRTPGGALTYDNPATGTVDPQEGLKQIEVYFNANDPLNVASATNPLFYQLIFTNDTATNTDDVVVNPNGAMPVVYNNLTGKATLTFNATLDTLGMGTARLRIGDNPPLRISDNQPLPPEPLAPITPADAGSSFDTANLDLGTLGSAASIVNGAIVDVSYNLTLPGGDTDPGHRQVPQESHLTGTADATPGLTTIYYDFREDYGVNPSGVTLDNQISATQMRRVREIFDLYSRHLGVQFVETTPAFGVDSPPPTPGNPLGSITIAAGLLAAINPAVASGIGGTIGLSGAPNVVMGGDPVRSRQLVVLDNADFNGAAANEFGGTFFVEASRLIGQLLGYGPTQDLPTLPATDPQYPSPIEILHGQHLFRPESNDIDVYQFQVAPGQHGIFTAETMAERLDDASGGASNLDTVLSLYGDVTTLKLPQGIDIADGHTFTLFDSVRPTVAVTFEFNSFQGVTAGNRPIAFTPGDTAEQIAAAVAQAIRNASTLEVEPVVEVDRVRLLGVSSVLGVAPAVTGAPFLSQSTSRELLARNDDYYSEDSYLEMRLRPGTYYVAVTSTGNTQFDPTIADSGYGGTTEGSYQLRTRFVPDAAANLVDLTGTVLDGDGDGVPGGNFNFWFQTSSGDADTIYVDKTASNVGQLGNLSNPFNNIGAAISLAASNPGRIIRVVANGGMDNNLATAGDNLAYEVGLNDSNVALADGATLRLPFNTTMMVDPGVVFKMRRANIEVGSSSQAVDRSLSHLQVLGRPDLQVQFTSYRDETIGADLDPTITNPATGDWGGLVFRNDADRLANHDILEDEGIFLNSVNNAVIRYGGGLLPVNSVDTRFSPIHLVESRPALTFNTISQSAEAAMSADPNSFADSKFQDLTYTADYERIGPDIHGNRAVGNSINGLFIRIETSLATGVPTRTLLVPARLDDTDIVHVLTENLLIQGSPGGNLDADGPGPGLPTSAGRQDARLAIDPGIVIKLQGARIETQGGSNLIAEGTPQDPILFVSLLDDRYGAGGSYDTTGDGTLSSPAAGNWGGLYFAHNSSGSIDHARITHGGGDTTIEGGFARFDAVEIHQADVRIANSTIANSASGLATGTRNGRGTNDASTIFIRGAQPVLINNILRDNIPAAISIDVNSLLAIGKPDSGRSTGFIDAFAAQADNQGPLIRLNRLGNNGINGLEVRAGTLTTAGVWDDTDIVHVVRNEISVGNEHSLGGLRLQSSPTESLVVKLSGVNAGFTARGTASDIDDRIGGTVQLVGNGLFPVALTALLDDDFGAGFTPDGLPQNDTDNAALATPGLPTGPEVNNGTLIDNDVLPTNTPGFFRYQPQNGGGLATGGVNGITAQGAVSLVNNTDAIFEFFNFVDPGSNGGALNLAATTITSPATLIGPDLVRSTGTFMGANGLVNWTVDSTFPNGVPRLINTITFTSAQPLGNLRFINYLDEDILGAGNDFLFPTGTPGQADFRAFTLDNVERIGFSHGGIYQPGPGLTNATYDGWAADRFNNLQAVIGGAGTTYSIAGNINTVNLPPVIDPALGQIYGPTDITNAFAWSVNPAATTATITAFLELVATNPASIPPGQWRSVQLQQFSNDRNVEIITPRESIAPGSPAVDDTPGTARFVGELAPDQFSGNDDRRLGFEIHGYLRSADVDVYSFTGTAGTEVWLDIDNTTPGLDTVLELVDADGNVLARSNDSAAESANPGILPTLLLPAMNQARTMQRGAFSEPDLFTTNRRDAGMRVVLPFLNASVDRYFVRVRSNSTDLSFPDLGRTQGNYQLQIRLQEQDESPGSTVQGADLRFATLGIDVQGGPKHSPLLGDAGESRNDVGNELFAGAATTGNVGNVLASDTGALSIAGALANATDVDWYQFTLDHDLLPTLAGNRTWSTVFDIDYADGLSRPDTQIAVYNSTGELILLGRDSDVLDDRDSAGTTVLSGGSLGTADPYIGSVQLPSGGSGSASRTYVVAVFSNGQVPVALNANFTAAAGANRAVRLEPIGSTRRVVEDHIGFSGYTSGTGTNTSPVDPVEAGGILDISSSLELSTHVRPFTLSDVTLYVSTDTELRTYDPSTGQLETVVGLTPGTAANFNGDIALRSDGQLFAYQGQVGSATSAGRLQRLDPGNAAAVGAAQNDLIPNAVLVGDQVDGLAFQRTGPAAYDYYYSVRDGAGSRLFRANPATGSAALAAPFGSIGQIRAAVNGDIGVTTGMAFIGNTLYGVSNQGRVYTINTTPGVTAGVVTLLGMQLEVSPGVPVQFAGLTLGPQNLDFNGDGIGGDLATTLFAIATDGTMYALDSTTGAQVAVFDADLNGVFETTATTGLTNVSGLAFSPLDFNLWHPTLRGSTDAGHGVNVTVDNSRNPAAATQTINGRAVNEAGGASFYFGLEQFAAINNLAYFDYNGVNAQYGIRTQAAHEDLSATVGIPNTYNLPGGAYGSLVTDAFSLAGYSATDKPTLYFNYELNTQNTDSSTLGAMRDSARVFVSPDGGATWTMVATNNSIRDANGELPATYTVDATVPGGDPARQQVQELFERQAADGANRVWRQARIDLGPFAGQSNLLLRFDFSTSGDISDPNAPAGSIYSQSLPSDAFGDRTSNTRGQNNQFEGFYVDDIIVGFAERGEHVSSAPTTQTVINALTPIPGAPAPTPAGPYQLEIRRGNEYATRATAAGGPIVIDPLRILDTNDRAAEAITILATDGRGVTDGQTFQVSDGVRIVTFEFNSAGGVTAPNTAIAFLAADTAAQLAVKIRNAINAHPTLNVQATSIASSERVELFGAADVLIVNAPRTLTIDVVQSTMSEMGGNSLVNVTLSEPAPAGGLTVTLNSSDTTEAAGPAMINIPAGQVTISFTLVAVDDPNVDGTQTAVITGTAFGYNSISDTIDVTDNEVRALGITLAPTTISEAALGVAASGTITRAGTLGDLVVTLLSTDTSEATVVVGTVTILNGFSSAPFDIAAVNDLLDDGDQTLSITALASGYSSASIGLTVTDDDAAGTPTPTLMVVITAATISESGGLSNVTVTRSGPTVGALMVNLSSSDVGEATVPVMVTIPDTQSSIMFTVTGVDDLVADGTQTVVITASAAGFDSVVDTIDISDNETRQLNLIIAAANVLENAGTGATTATVTRTSEDNSLPLVVNLQSSNLNAARVPLTVTIPAGQASATFAIEAIDEFLPSGSQTVTFTAYAAGFASGIDTLIVTDVANTLLHDRIGDVNPVRPQGHVLISGNRVQDSSTFGIRVDSAARDANNTRPHPGVPRNLNVQNPARLTPSVTIENNVVAFSGTAGILFSGDAVGGNTPLAAVPFGRIVNNTIFGSLTNTGLGIQVTENASPTILNNILANLTTAITIDVSSQAAGTILGGTFYKKAPVTPFDTGAVDNGRGSFALDPDELNPAGDIRVFRDPTAGDFELVEGSLAIDSSVNSLPERPELQLIYAALGFPESPVLAPETDITGRTRKDNTFVISPPGLGTSVFKDRGAIERLDPVLLAGVDQTVTETDATNNAVVVVTLSEAVSFTVTVAYTTTPGTAAAGADYTSTSGMLTFLPNQTTQLITVPIVGDLMDEFDETFSILFSNINSGGPVGSGPQIGDPLTQITIVDNDPLPSFSIDDLSQAEGDVGITNFVFTVRLSSASGKPTLVQYATADGTLVPAALNALAGSDYNATNGTLTFLPGATTQLVTVQVLGNFSLERDETFTVNLSNPVEATIADATANGVILDDEPIITIGSLSLEEGNLGLTPFPFLVTLSKPSNLPISVVVNTSDGNLAMPQFNATTADNDYQPVVNFTLNFMPMQTTATVPVQVVGDNKPESNETFRVLLSGAVDAKFADDETVPGIETTGTILDDEPFVSIINNSIVEADAGLQDLVFTVVLSRASNVAVNVPFTTGDGSAVAPSDYQSLAGMVMFVPMDLTEFVTVKVQGDTLDEDNETFTVTLSQPPLANFHLGTAVATGTIVDNETNIVPVLSTASQTVVEGDAGTTPMNFVVTLSSAVGRTVTVRFDTQNNTAVAGSDFVGASNGTLTFLSGETQKTIAVLVNGDQTLEPNENFFLNLSAPVNATVGTPSVTGTIIDDEARASINPTVTVIGDNGGTSAVFTISLTDTHPTPITVNFSTANGPGPFPATANIDYQAISSSVVFAVGETTKLVTVPVLADTLDEEDETFSVNISGVTNLILAGQSQGVATIVDGEDVPPTITITNVSVSEGDFAVVNALFTLSLSNASGKPITVDFATQNGVVVPFAQAGADYNSTTGVLTFTPGQTARVITVGVLGDLLGEPNETYHVNLTSPTNASFPGMAMMLQATGTIIDNEPRVSIADRTVFESDGVSVNADFVVTLSKASDSGVPISIVYQTTNGTAIGGVDFTATTATLVFNPGETVKSILVPITGDLLDEDNETFFIDFIGPATNALIADGQAAGLIVDNDGLPSLSIFDTTLIEGNAGTTDMLVRVTLSPASGRTVTVSYATANNAPTSAAAGSDYTATSGLLTFLEGETEKFITVPIVGDVLGETDETFLVNLTAPTNATITDNQALNTILDDEPRIVISGPAPVTEGNVNAVFTVSLVGTPTGNVSFTFATANGTAMQPGDFTATSGTLTFDFGLGETTKLVTVAVLDDMLNEATESFSVNLTGSSNNVVILTSQATASILDNDGPPTITILGTTVTEGNSGTVDAVFDVRLSSATGLQVLVPFTTTNGTATVGGADFNPNSGTVTFSPGSTQQFITVQVRGDVVGEPNESFFVTLSSPTNGVFPGFAATLQGTATILDDEPRVSIDDVSVMENDSSTIAAFTVLLTSPPVGNITVTFTTAAGTATAGADYTTTTGTVTFSAALGGIL